MEESKKKKKHEGLIRKCKTKKGSLEERQERGGKNAKQAAKTHAGKPRHVRTSSTS